MTQTGDKVRAGLFATYGATLSSDRVYRYRLWRVWDDRKPRCLFIMLNPSTANEGQDDPTIRKCMKFARRWGYGGIDVCNLFAFRATSPEDMKAAAEPIGPENDEYLINAAAQAGKIICAWGNHGYFLTRSYVVRAMLPQELFAFKINRTGEPAHPLYQRDDAELIAWNHGRQPPK